MPFPNLQSFLSFLERKGDLHRIKVQVDPILEITEIATRVVQQKGPALLFENVKGSSFPLLINVLGAERRVNWALGRSPQEVGEELAHFAEGMMPPSPKKMWAHRASLFRVLAMRPKKVCHPPVFKNKIEPADLDRLPIAQSWPKDGGRFITFPLVVTKSPVDGKLNMGVYRMQVYGNNQTGMHWQIAKGGGYHYQQSQAQKNPLPLVAVLGADPILMLCGVLPLPEGLDEMAFAGFLRGQNTPVAISHKNSLRLPSEAEFLLEGFVPPEENRMEGPYGDHFGHYSHPALFPVFHVERIWHRDNPVFPIAVVGKPPQEDQVIGDAVQEILLPLLKIMHPEVIDMWAYQEAGFHNLLVARVKQRFEKEAIKTGLWILGEGQLALTKCVILVDEKVNARSFPEVMKAIRAFFDPSEDFLLLPGTSQDTLDFTSFKMNLGSKMILDATSGKKARPSSSYNIEQNKIKSVDSRVMDTRLLWDSLLVVQAASQGREILEKMLGLPGLDQIPLVIAVSKDVPMDDPTLLLWGIFTRFDCARDTFFLKTRQKGGHLVYEGTLFIDATWKPGYPEPLLMDSDIVRRVDERWGEYGFK